MLAILTVSVKLSEVDKKQELALLESSAWDPQKKAFPFDLTGERLDKNESESQVRKNIPRFVWSCFWTPWGRVYAYWKEEISSTM